MRTCTHTHTLFNRHFTALDSNIWGFEARSFYKPDALPVAETTASKVKTLEDDVQL